MAKTRLFSITKKGQEVWHDDLYRELVLSGSLRKMIDEDGLSGLTSNPTIFEKAFKSDPIYKHDMLKLISLGKSIDEIYNALIFTDIRLASQAFENLFDESKGELGYVCLEVSPLLAYKPQETYEEVKRLLTDLEGIENLMIKVPGTKEGVEAIRKLVAEGYNINVTLLFSVNHYREAAKAYIQGLEERRKKNQSISNIRGVASVFLSRIDTLIDEKLQEIINSEKSTAGEKKLAEKLLGSAAIAIGRLVYREFKQLFGSKEFESLEAYGGNIQKPLWASTGTKNPSYSDVKYVESLIYPDTVVTMPGATMSAFRDHGKVKIALEDYEAQEKVISGLRELELDIEKICDELQIKGEKAFVDSYLSTRGIIEEEMEKGFS